MMVLLEDGAARGLAAAADQRDRQVLRVVVAAVHAAREGDHGVLEQVAVALLHGGELARELSGLLRVPPADGGEAVVGVARVLQAVIAADRVVALFGPGFA